MTIFSTIFDKCGDNETSGWVFTKLLKQIRKIFRKFEVLLRSRYSLKIGTL
jgi:hypothetical protein